MNKPLRTHLLALFVSALTAAAPARAASPDPPAVDARDRAAIVDDIAAALREGYVFPEVAARMEAHVRQQLASGAYDRLGTLDVFVQKLAEDLRSVSHDRHLDVRWDREPPAPQAEGPAPGDLQARMEAGMRRENYGFRKVERLSGNVGYLKLDQFAPVDLGGGTAVAAMGFLAASDALIFDLRDNHGGDPSMVQLIASYLFSGPTHFVSMYNRLSDKTRQFWTAAWVPGTRLPDVPVFILTSSGTFSGAESFAYALKHLKRATVVGEVTGGGANPAQAYQVEGYPVIVSLPFARPIDPVTGTDWEGTGVEPDVAAAAPEALAVAHERALAAIAEKAADPAQKAELEFLRQVLQDRRQPASLSTAELQAFAGTYGEDTITLEGGALWYRSGKGLGWRLLPVGQDRFLVGDLDDVRFRFERDARGRVVRLIEVRPGGEEPRARSAGPTPPLRP
jgi:retinol-binding protein 3